ncbi:putative serine protease inhibitor [Candidatus Desulfarcum epimagneticum]|uniref:Putative serine protease inhibitor n=1 Tax=uncultured Desulfobacteraceae bacterium TaxID=218296 RepID=A0A484HE49_9BACT|nr:putative serine protease inhibitor [uncultured Desulfobacteraceae bacterium]
MKKIWALTLAAGFFFAARSYEQAQAQARFQGAFQAKWAGAQTEPPPPGKPASSEKQPDAKMNESIIEKIEKSEKKWRELKKKWRGNYSYKKRFSSWTGFGNETTIVVRNNRVEERHYREWRGDSAAPEGEKWVEKGPRAGSHKKGAKALTLDALYQKAKAVAGKAPGPHEKMYVRFDRRGLLNACFYINVRIMDDAPGEGVDIAAIKPDGAPDIPGETDADDATGALSLVMGNAAFAVKLYGELGASEGNLFFSPHGISTAMAMTDAGARENTAKEIKNALNFEIDPPRLSAAFKKLNQKLAAHASESGQQLIIANGLSLTGGDVSPGFKAALKNDYDAEVFAGDLDPINEWVKKKTKGKIKKILEKLDPYSVCVLLNAICFKGLWQNPFKEIHTRQAPFKFPDGKQTTVSLMYQKSDFKLLDEKNFQAAEIPCKENRMSMIVLLPRNVDGLGKLESGLTHRNLEKWLAALDQTRAREARLFLPKFKFETGYDLAAPLKNMGVKDAFDANGKADFRGMGWPKGKLFISRIKHKAFVEVNEEGAEAAAATAVEMAARSIRRYPVFRADHPFLFIIKDNETGAILFMGRVADPGGT